MLPALPRMKLPELLPGPVPGIRQCTPQAQGFPFLEDVLGMVLPFLMGWAMHTLTLIFPFQIKHQLGTVIPVLTVPSLEDQSNEDSGRGSG